LGLVAQAQRAARHFSAGTGGAKVSAVAFLMSARSSSNLARCHVKQTPVVTPADMANRSLDNPFALGKNMGVLTKYSLNKHGVLMAKAQTPASSSPPAFVKSAVPSMRDDAEGIASLKKCTTEAMAKSPVA
jgi:hypothetical protein